MTAIEKSPKRTVAKPQLHPRTAAWFATSVRLPQMNAAGAIDSRRSVRTGCRSEDHPPHGDREDRSAKLRQMVGASQTFFGGDPRPVDR